MASQAPEVVHVGSASRDVTGDDPRGWRLGGGAPYAALTTARLGLRTAALIGVDPAAAAAAEMDLLRDAGVDVVLVSLDECPVFVNRETRFGRVQTCVTVGRPLPTRAAPSSWRDVPAWSLVPVAGELDGAWASAVPDSAFVSLGWQGLLRHLQPGHVVARSDPDASPLVHRADVVGVSRHDLAAGTRPDDLLRWLRTSARLVLTDGPNGGRMLQRTNDGTVAARRYRAVKAERDVDPTGAGDVFLAALLVSAIRGVTGAPGSGTMPNLDLAFAAAAASFAVEGPGLLGVPNLAAVKARFDRN